MWIVNLVCVHSSYCSQLPILRIFEIFFNFELAFKRKFCGTMRFTTSQEGPEFAQAFINSRQTFCFPLASVMAMLKLILYTGSWRKYANEAWHYSSNNLQMCKTFFETNMSHTLFYWRSFLGQKKSGSSRHSFGYIRSYRQ